MVHVQTEILRRMPIMCPETISFHILASSEPWQEGEQLVLFQVSDLLVYLVLVWRLFLEPNITLHHVDLG